MSQTESTCQPDSALADKVIEVLADKLGKPARTIHLEDDLLLDLGVDSLNMAEMTVLVEQVGGSADSGRCVARRPHRRRSGRAARTLFPIRFAAGLGDAAT